MLLLGFRNRKLAFLEISLSVTVYLDDSGDTNF